MLLTSPIVITPRLLPGIRIDNSFISIDYRHLDGKLYRDSHNDNRVYYRYWLDLDLDGKKIESYGEDISSGCNHCLQNGLSSLLTFLSACGESYAYAMRNDMPLSETEHGELFPPNVAEWAYQNSDELSILQCELEEADNLIQERE